ncbi:MAG: hypothetical protein HZB76_00465 [Chlamydiae bacterium]|nr:hypothetical protein [Chlamydiota bacterium]
MDFTREPIIETVITPKEGNKLILRNSKVTGQEEYLVEAVEVVSFGQSCFFRSLDAAKEFLVPVTDFEISEVREARMVLKTANVEKIKIGGGKDSHEQSDEASERRKKKQKRRMRQEEMKKEALADAAAMESAPASTEPVVGEPEVASPSVIRKLFPPPPTLIKEKLNYIKQTEGITEPQIKPEIAKEEVLVKEEVFEEERRTLENPLE